MQLLVTANMSDTEADIDPSKISDPEYLTNLLRNFAKENKALKTAREQDAAAAQATQDRIRTLESEKTDLENSVQALQTQTAGTSNRRESTGMETVRTTIKTPNLTECSSLNQYLEEVKWWQNTVKVPKDKQAVILLREMSADPGDGFGGLRTTLVNYIGEANVMTADAVDKMIKKLKELLQHTKFVRLVQWMRKLFKIRQDKGWSMDRYFLELDKVFLEGSTEFGVNLSDQFRAAALVQGVTGLNPEQLGNIMQDLDVDDEQATSTLYDESKKLIKKHIMARAIHFNPGASNSVMVTEEAEEEGLFESPFESFLAGQKGRKPKTGAKHEAGGLKKKKLTREQCKARNLCYICESADHLASSCPHKAEYLEKTKRNVLARGKAWKIRGVGGAPDRFEHPDGNIYDYETPLHTPVPVKISMSDKGAKRSVSQPANKKKPKPSCTVTSGQQDHDQLLGAAIRRGMQLPPSSGLLDFDKNPYEGVREDDELFSPAPTGNSPLFQQQDVAAVDEGLNEDILNIDEHYEALVNCMGNINFINIASKGVGRAILDTGCQKSCGSQKWTDDYVEALPDHLKKLVRVRNSQATFKFGGPQLYPSLKYIIVPIKFGDRVKLLGYDVVAAEIPLLISLEVFQKLGMAIQFNRDRPDYIMYEDQRIEIEQSSGHHWMDVLPDNSMQLQRQEAASVLQSSSQQQDQAAEDSQDESTPAAAMEYLTALNDGAVGHELDDKKISAMTDKVHKQMAHPPKVKMIKLFKSAGLWSDNVEKALDVTYKNCDSKDCRARESCQKVKKVAWRGEAKGLGDLVAMDLKISKGNQRDILYLVDIATSYVLATLIESKRPEHIAEKITEVWFGRGFPIIKKMLSDNGLEFTGSAMQEYFTLMGICHKTTVARTPEQNGSVERIHSVVDRNISKLMDDNPHLKLDMALVWAVNAYNYAELRSGYSPAQLVFGIQDNFIRLLDRTAASAQDENLPGSHRASLAAREQALANHYQFRAGEKVKEMVRVKTVPSRTYKPVGAWVYFKRSQETTWSGPGQIWYSLGSQVAVKVGNKFFSCRQDDILPLHDKDMERYGLHFGIPVSDDEDQPRDVPSTMRGPQSQSEQVFELVEGSNHQGVDTSVQQNVREVQNPSTEAEKPAVQEPEVDTGGQIADQDGQDQQGAGQQNPPPANTRANPDAAGLRKHTPIEVQDADGSWWKGEILCKDKKRTASKGGNWFQIQFVPGNRRSVRSINLSPLSGSVWRHRQEAEGTSAGCAIQVGKHHVFKVEEGEISSVCVSAVPYYQHSLPEVVAAKQSQLDVLKQFGTFYEVSMDSLSESQKKLIIPTTWAIVFKYVDGERKVKARLCARGDREVSKNRTDCPTVSKQAIRLLLSKAASEGWIISSLDFTAAFLQGQNIERELYLLPPADIRQKAPGIVWKVVKRIYGLKDASRGWYLELNKALTELGCKPTLVDLAMYVYKNEQGQIQGLAAVHIDDILYCGEAEFHEKVIDKLIASYVIGKVEKEKFTFTGWDLKQSGHEIVIQQSGFTDRLDLSRFDKLDLSEQNKDTVLPDELQQLFRSLVGAIGWVSQVSRPDRAAHQVYLSINLGKATFGDAKQALRIIRNVKDSPQTIKFSNLGNLSEAKLLCWSDSSFGKQKAQTVNGVILFVQGQNKKMNVLDWNAQKMQVPVTSPLSGECEAALEGYSRIKWIRSLYEEIVGKQAVRAVIRTDSKSLVSSINSAAQVKDKRAMVCVATLRAIYQHDDVEIIWTPGSTNIADHLTKTTTNGNILRKLLEGEAWKPSDEEESANNS